MHILIHRLQQLLSVVLPRMSLLFLEVKLLFFTTRVGVNGEILGTVVFMLVEYGDWCGSMCFSLYRIDSDLAPFYIQVSLVQSSLLSPRKRQQQKRRTKKPRLVTRRVLLNPRHPAQRRKHLPPKRHPRVLQQRKLHLQRSSHPSRKQPPSRMLRLPERRAHPLQVPPPPPRKQLLPERKLLQRLKLKMQPDMCVCSFVFSSLSTSITHPQSPPFPPSISLAMHLV